MNTPIFSVRIPSFIERTGYTSIKLMQCYGPLVTKPTLITNTPSLKTKQSYSLMYKLVLNSWFHSELGGSEYSGRIRTIFSHKRSRLAQSNS